MRVKLLDPPAVDNAVVASQDPLLEPAAQEDSVGLLFEHVARDVVVKLAFATVVKERYKAVFEQNALASLVEQLGSCLQNLVPLDIAIVLLVHLSCPEYSFRLADNRVHLVAPVIKCVTVLKHHDVV